MADGNIDNIPGISHEDTYRTPVVNDIYRDNYDRIVWNNLDRDTTDGKPDS